MMISPIYKEPTEKMILMFDAVAALLEEGADVKDLKVSDITKRAGIGKGTAYEYFSSKEELLLEAQIYYFQQKVEHLCEQVGKAETFEEAILACCHAIDRMLENETGMSVLFRHALSGAEEVGQCACDDTQNMDHFFDSLAELGKKEGLITKTDDEMIRCILVTELVGYGISCSMWRKRHKNLAGYKEHQEKMARHCLRAMRLFFREE